MTGVSCVYAASHCTVIDIALLQVRLRRHLQYLSPTSQLYQCTHHFLSEKGALHYRHIPSLPLLLLVHSDRLHRYQKKLPWMMGGIRLPPNHRHRLQLLRCPRRRSPLKWQDGRKNASRCVFCLVHGTASNSWQRIAMLKEQKKASTKP